MTDEIPFGEWLRRQRRAQDLTRQALADQAGCAEVTLRRIENGTLKPSKELAQILLEKLGIPELERSQWILFARGLAGFPTPPVDSSLSQPLSNLPASLTTFIGREKEQAEIIKHIRKYRLVTLTGPGGVGKTRLSIKVGEQLLGDYANGVWLVELAALNDPTLLPQTVMALFGIAAQPNTSSTEILSNFLRAKTILLLLDNCEHLLEACAQLADTLLKNCPNLKILATSRETLSITGEATYPVPSLSLPDLEQLLENFREYESVRLFEERAQLAKVDFSLTMENASSVAQICHRLDGIPLAIELAAAHVNMFSTNQIATRLNESFNLLTGGSRTALPRQQTIRASIEWSWNLLSDAERILLRRLSVFAGGWILESAESVCSEKGVEKKRVFDLLSQLVAKSLVVVNQASGRERQYHLLETIRQYVDEKLVKAGEKETIRTWHLKYFLGLSEQAESALRGSEQGDWLVRLDNERDNIRAALEWADQTNLEAGLYLSGRLRRFWDNFDLREGKHWLNRFIQNTESNIYPHARAKALCAWAYILHDFQQLAQAHTAAQECLDLFKACGNQHDEIDGLLVLAWIAGGSGNLAKLIEFAQQALVLSQSLDDTWRKAQALWILGWAHRDESYQAFLEEAIMLLRKEGDLRSLVGSLNILGTFEMLNGNLDSAQIILDEAILLIQQSPRKKQMLNILAEYGQLAMRRGDFDKARAHLEEGASITKELGHRLNYLSFNVRLGYLALWQGDVTKAHTIFTRTVQDFYADQNKEGIAVNFEGLASLNVLIGKPNRAAQLIGWADATREQIGVARWKVEQDDVDRAIAAIRARISDSAFDEAYNNGYTMILDEAIAFVLDTKGE